MGWLSKRLFGLSLEEVTFARRGFRGGDMQVQAHLEKVGRSFLRGYHSALEQPRPERLERRLGATEVDYRGFAFEGAAMALAMLDLLTPWRRRRFAAFVDGCGKPHVYMAHVGAGWAIARLPLGMPTVLRRLDPLLKWLALDGYGFHEGYFHWPKSVVEHEVPERLTGYARRAFDQGLGRSLWFVDGADVERIPATIASFPAARRGDLWCGVGLSSTYAGGVEREALQALLEASAAFRPQLAQGAAFAAEARRRAGNPTEHSELACRLFCNLSGDDAAQVTERTRRDLPTDDGEPAYEVWKRRIRKTLAGESLDTGSDRPVGAPSLGDYGNPQAAVGYGS